MSGTDAESKQLKIDNPALSAAVIHALPPSATKEHLHVIQHIISRNTALLEGKHESLPSDWTNLCTNNACGLIEIDSIREKEDLGVESLLRLAALEAEYNSNKNEVR